MRSRGARARRAVPRQRRRRHRRPRRGVAHRRRGERDARGLCRRRCDVRPRSPSLAPRRRRAPPPDRPGDGRSRGDRSLARHGRRRGCDAGRGCSEVALPARRRGGREPRRPLRARPSRRLHPTRRRPRVSDPTFWLLARASGLTAYTLLTLVVLAGLVVKAKPLAAVRPAAAVDVHRFLTTLAIGAVALHAATLVLDSRVHIGARALLVPGAAPYRPLATGAGVVAMELMLLVAISFPLRRRIGVRAWRRLHWTTYGIFALATAHGLFAGTDAARPWALDLYLGAVGAVASVAAWRALVPPRLHHGRSTCCTASSST